MRVAVITDIHGNIGALIAVLADLRRVSPDHVIFGGDIALFGSHGLECWQRVTDLGWALVQGNTDRYLVNPGPKLRTLRKSSVAMAKSLTRTIEWTQDQIGSQMVDQLATMPTVACMNSKIGPLIVVHGAPGNDETGLFPDASDDELEKHLRAVEAQVLVCGHTHRVFIRHVGKVLVVNSGSVGRSYDGQPGQGTYAVFDDVAGRWSASIRRVAYDEHAAYRQSVSRGVPLSDAVRKVLLTGCAPDRP